MGRIRLKRLHLFLISLFLVLAVTGGIFASGFSNTTATLATTPVHANFADVVPDTSHSPTWTFYGGSKGYVNPGTLFEISTVSSNYTGDIGVTLSIANPEELTKDYRVLFLKVVVKIRRGLNVDINGDGIVNSKDVVPLTLVNGEVHFFIRQAVPDWYKIELDPGWYESNPYSGNVPATPLFYCEINQE